MNGIILINKEKKWTSHDIVAKVKNILHTKVGHTGTLDPNATGVLPLLLGDATKVSKYLIEHDKEYIAEIKLGMKTDTADEEGNVIEKENIDVTNYSKEYVENTLKKFIGKSYQTPPIYSAIKVNGKKLYDYARSKEKVEIPKREIEIYSIKLIDIEEKENIIKFWVHCSKGTYIRTLCENIANELGTIGYMKNLQRIKVGKFDIKDSITIEKLLNEMNNIKKYIITIENLFQNVDKIILNSSELEKFLNGVKIINNKKDGIYRIYNEKNKFIGIGVNKDKKIKRDIIIN